MEIRKETQEEMLRYWVWLSLVFGAGSTKLLQFVHQAESPQEIYEAMQEGRLRGVPESALKAMPVHSLGEADSIVYYCRKNDIHLLAIDSEAYPQMLRDIPAAPVLLTARGNLKLLKNPLSLAVVGTRHPSPYTERVTTTFIRQLAQQKFTIVSGFARGVDACAHQAALDGGGTTIAVLGCGINVNYPRENQALRQEMISSGRGLFLSEYMPGAQPYPACFPKRNRILSGLSNATAVMEAAERSGSLLTAQCAAEQGRFLYAVPPADLFDPRYAGVIPLLRDGAFPLMSPQDIEMSYYSRFPQYYTLRDPEMRSSERLVFQENRQAPKQSAHTKAAPKTQPKPPAEPAAPKPEASAGTTNLPENESDRRIVEYLRESGDSYADDLAAVLDMDLSELLSALTMLELDGYVESLFGKQFRAC